MSNSLKKAVKNLGIPYLYHFTRFENLDSILKHGLIGRQKLEERGIDHSVNDSLRLDGELSAICCSIGHPNYKMFYPLRLGNPDVDWIVLALKKSVIWNKTCAFCSTNAASGTVTSISIEDRIGFTPFVSLFNELENIPSRSELKLDKYCPTDPQAEVLVLEDIEPKFIVGGMTANGKLAEELRAKYPKFIFKYVRQAFGPRTDYEHWK